MNRNFNLFSYKYLFKFKLQVIPKISKLNKKDVLNSDWLLLGNFSNTPLRDIQKLIFFIKIFEPIFSKLVINSSKFLLFTTSLETFYLFKNFAKFLNCAFKFEWRAGYFTNHFVYSQKRTLKEWKNYFEPMYRYKYPTLIFLFNVRINESNIILKEAKKKSIPVLCIFSSYFLKSKQFELLLPWNTECIISAFFITVLLKYIYTLNTFIKRLFLV